MNTRPSSPRRRRATGLLRLVFVVLYVVASATGVNATEPRAVVTLSLPIDTSDAVDLTVLSVTSLDQLVYRMQRRDDELRGGRSTVVRTLRPSRTYHIARVRLSASNDDPVAHCVPPALITLESDLGYFVYFARSRDTGRPIAMERGAEVCLPPSETQQLELFYLFTPDPTAIEEHPRYDFIPPTPILSDLLSIGHRPSAGPSRGRYPGRRK